MQRYVSGKSSRALGGSARGRGRRKTKTQWLVSKQVQRSPGSDSVQTGLRVAEPEFARIYLTLIFREAFCGVCAASFLLSERPEQLSAEGPLTQPGRL